MAALMRATPTPSGQPEAGQQDSNAGDRHGSKMESQVWNAGSRAASTTL